MPPKLAATLLVLLAGLAPVARADWPAGGKVVVQPYLFDTGLAHGTGPCQLFSVPDGSVLLLGAYRGGNTQAWSVQRISADGDSIPGWRQAGWFFTGLLGAYHFRSQGYSIGDDGALLRSFPFITSTSIKGAYAQRVDLGGVLAPSGASGWLAGANPSVLLTSVAPGPSGGTYIAWQDRIQRLTAAGAVAPGWPAAGASAFTTNGSSLSETGLCSDGAGGVVAFGASNFSTGVPRAIRYDSSGVRHAGWPVGGVALSPDTAFALPEALNPRLIRSGSAHFIAGWLEDFVTPRRIHVQRFSIDGAVAGGWPASGAVATSDTFACATLIEDGRGGVYIVWERNGQPRATHVDSTGAYVGGLGANGVPLVGAEAQYVSQTNAGVPTGELAATLAPGGGLFLAWEDARLSPTVSYRVRRFLPDLTLDPAEPADGRLVLPTQAWSIGSLRAILGDGLGGVYLAWHAGSSVAMTHLVPFAALDSGPRRAVAALSLSAPAPNPARDAFVVRFVLPDARPAALELFDLTGRRRRSSHVAGAGPHEAGWADLGDVPPGLYWLRLAQGSAQQVVRVVVAR